MNKSNVTILCRAHCITTVLSIAVNVRIIIRHHHRRPVHHRCVLDRILLDHVTYRCRLIQRVTINVRATIELVISATIIVFLNLNRC